MIVDCISDLHGHFPKLEGGDLLIVAGDLTARDEFQELADFYIWLDKQDYKKKIVIAGNHDNYFYACHTDINPPIVPFSLKNTEYLCDSVTEFEYWDREINYDQDLKVWDQKMKKIKIWGSPWTSAFEGMNPHCKAFTVDTEKELADKWSLIPNDTDILVTHSPPACILDDVENYAEGQIENVGSFQLIHYLTVIQPKLHVFGHIHEGYGKATAQNLQIIQNLFPNTIFVNASHVNERYQPVNPPIRIEL